MKQYIIYVCDVAKQIISAFNYDGAWIKAYRIYPSYALECIRVTRTRILEK